MNIGIIKKAILKTNGKNKALSIVFNTDVHLTLNTYVRISFLDVERYFKVFEIQTEDSFRVNATAMEIGYWAQHLSQKDDFDIKDIMGLGITLLTDKDKIDKLNEVSGYL